jgi:23S rRNA (uridine2552-2'-O)-methyltransferase
MTRSKSSQRWLKDHFKDPYVKQAQTEGRRSRALFKLKQIDEKYHLIKKGDCVVDLGAAPGGWSEYAAPQLGPSGTLIALDILPMDSLAGVTFIQGDFTEDVVMQQLVAVLGDKRANLVLSDMAPNMSGIKDVDQSRSVYLAELALEVAARILAPGGHFLVKLFHGAGFDAYVKAIRQQFEKVQVIKPDASRAKSSEVYLLARHYTQK